MLEKQELLFLHAPILYKRLQEETMQELLAMKWEYFKRDAMLMETSFLPG